MNSEMVRADQLQVGDTVRLAALGELHWWLVTYSFVQGNDEVIDINLLRTDDEDQASFYLGVDQVVERRASQPEGC